MIVGWSSFLDFLRAQMHFLLCARTLQRLERKHRLTRVRVRCNRAALQLLYLYPNSSQLLWIKVKSLEQSPCVFPDDLIVTSRTPSWLHERRLLVESLTL